MQKIEEYREFAAACVNMATATEDNHYKAVLLGMADAWLGLAVLAEKNRRTDLICEPPPAQPQAPPVP